MKRAILFIFLSIISILGAAEFEVYTEINSFLDEDGNTINDFIFKVPHENLGYVNDGGNRVSIFKTKYKILQDGKIIIDKVLTNNIIRTKKSENHYFIDKISLTIKIPNLKIKVTYIDELTHKTYKWEGDLEYIQPNAMLSSIEFNKKIERASGRYRKFLREDILFLPNPHHNYFLPDEDSLYFYYEFYNLAKKENLSKINVNIQISKQDSLIYQSFNEYEISESRGSHYHKIGIADFDAGLYKIEIQMVDLIGRRTTKAEDIFVIRERKNDLISVFGNIEDDYALIKYFLSNSEKNVWRKLSIEGKLNFIDHFWKVADTNPASTENEFFELINNRVELTNKKYGSINVIGWKSDMGRISIRNGIPDDIVKDETDSSYTRYVSKNYEIWKYYNGMKLYLFIDKMNNGRYKLIYIKNDDLENTALDWERLLGNDFDTSLLEF